jgi:beta-glucosidase-like glycosyl hydrolase
MNIHRNPLCGRNFEYYSEDPLIAGLTAAAETEGVETLADGSSSGVGVTLKHFAFNNQEEDRSGTNAVVSERAAREIYLRGFQIAVENSQPDYIMTSYNMVNGTSTFENYGLITETLRNEWGFEGFVMTDWMSANSVFGKNKDKNSRGLLMYAGNDCEMPGSNETQLLSALSEGTTMRLGDLQRSAINMLNVIKESAVFDIMKAKLDAASGETGTGTGTGTDTNTGNKTIIKTNSAGKKVTVTVTETKDSAGNVTGSKEVSVINSPAKNTSVTVTVTKNAAGEIKTAKASVTKTGAVNGSSTKVSLPETLALQIQEASGQKNVDVTLKVVDTAGKTKYVLKADAIDLAKKGKNLYAYILNTKTGEYTALNSKTYTVSSEGKFVISLSKKATYVLVDSQVSRSISNGILADVKAAKSSVTLKKGAKTTFTLSGKPSQANIKSITYTTSKKSVATVSKAGKITAVKAGTATIKATVTLKSGKSKTVSMKVKVK